MWLSYAYIWTLVAMIWDTKLLILCKSSNMQYRHLYEYQLRIYNCLKHGMNKNDKTMLLAKYIIASFARPAKQVRIRIGIDYWWNAETAVIHQDLWLGKLVPSSHQRSESSNTILCNFSRWVQRIGEDIPIPDSLGEEVTFINICISNGDLKCLWVLISTTPSIGNKVLCWYTGFTFQTFI